MYENVMVALDNSEGSQRALAAALGLARVCGARLTGAHVYAASLHYERFRHLEPSLPAPYQSEEKLAYQREVHDDLIGRGLRIISDSYLDVFERACRGAQVPFERKALEGRHYERIVEDARATVYDLVVVGAHGLGRTERSGLGSVCERVLRLAGCDVLVVREPDPPGAGPVAVAADGSAHAFAALDLASALARAAGGEVTALAAYDPYFHGVAFKSLSGVLSDEAAQLFRFREQERLHDEIIDQGLLDVYRSHLESARRRAERAGAGLRTEVLEGKPVDAVAAWLERSRPSLLVVGRHGIHRGAGVTLGSTAENLVRIAPCNVLVSARGAVAEPVAEPVAKGPAELRWSPEAEARLKRVPGFVRGMARRRIEGFARERGAGEISLELYEQARGHFGM